METDGSTVKITATEHRKQVWRENKKKGNGSTFLLEILAADTLMENMVTGFDDRRFVSLFRSFATAVYIYTCLMCHVSTSRWRQRNNRIGGEVNWVPQILSVFIIEMFMTIKPAYYSQPVES